MVPEFALSLQADIFDLTRYLFLTAHPSRGGSISVGLAEFTISIT